MYQPETERDFDICEGRNAWIGFRLKHGYYVPYESDKFRSSPEYRNARLAFRDRVNGQGARRS